MAKTGEKILVLDDDPGILTAARITLKKRYTQITVSADPGGILNKFRPGDFDLILLDMNFSPGMKSGAEGLDLIGRFLQIDPAVYIIAITAYGEIELAVRAMQSGAADFITKPWDNERLRTSVSNSLRMRHAGEELRYLKNRQKILQQDMDRPFSGIIGDSPAMRKVYGLVEKVASTEANVLITGENGTGKELVARVLHRLSGRRSDVFITVDLGAIPETLFESEMFGHRRGAFTGASGDREGRFEMASGGTLFLDEIGNLPLNLQQKLLSAIQNRKIIPVGADKPVSTDLRLVSATNKDLHKMVAEGKFRQDLLYRLNTVEIVIPPLRHRREDIPLLMDHYLGIFSRKYRRNFQKVPDAVYRKLAAYHWPGNVRELMHLVERAVILAEGDTLTTGDFPFEKTTIRSGAGHSLAELEKSAIEDTLAQHHQNISKAAKALGMGRSTLYRKMRKYGIQIL